MWEIPFVFLVLVLALISFVWEKFPPDLTALLAFGAVLAAGIVSPHDALSVFSNPAPITVGAMFVISAALDKSGLIDKIGASLQGLSNLSYAPFLLFIMMIAGSFSAFINNTPVVVVMLPIVLSLSKKMDIPGSKVLIPLSYSSILGGTCTLLGTSTNILVSGIAQSAGAEPFGMFEFAAVGIPLFFTGLIYLTIFGKKLLPVRETLTSILSEDERREYITEAFLDPQSPAIGKSLKESGIAKHPGIRVIDLVRSGISKQLQLDDLKLVAGDRLVLACRASGIAKARSLQGVDFVTEQKLGLEQIAAHEGMLVEGILGPKSDILGQTLEEINFRHRFRMVVLAVHRKGKNLRKSLGTVRLQFGDTLLMLGTNEAIESLRGNEDIILMGDKGISSRTSGWRAGCVLAAIAGVIACAATGIAKIEVAAIIACIFLFATNCITPKEGYASVQWNILFIIFAMLGMGKAMESSGASAWLSDGLTNFVTSFTSEGMRPYVMLACVYLLTNILTEILSNNAAAVLMGTLAIGIAESLGVDMRPFLFAVAIGASASFTTPIGYQTNTYVYGAGGYKFSDFVRIGLPLNLICFVISIVLIPMVWNF